MIGAIAQEAGEHLGVAGNEATMKDAWIRYSGWDFGKLTIGQFKHEFGLETLGMELLEGRWFRADEVKIIDFTSGDDFVDSVIVTETLAKKMFPGESAVGKPLFLETGDSVTIVGVTSDVACPWPKFAEDEVGGLYNTTFLPGRGSPPVARLSTASSSGSTSWPLDRATPRSSPRCQPPAPPPSMPRATATRPRSRTTSAPAAPCSRRWATG